MALEIIGYNATFNAFMKTVADMFGGVGSIPDNVKEAMKLEDYGKGKPLTARRRGALQDPGFAGCRVCGTRHRRRAAGRRLANRPRRGRAFHLSFAAGKGGGQCHRQGRWRADRASHAGLRRTLASRRKAGAVLRGGQDAVSFALRAAGGEARQKGNAHPRPCARRLGPWAFT